MDNEIVQTLVELKKGSLQAFEKIYNQFSGKLHNYILKVSKGDEYLAEEVLQSTFMLLWENRAQIDSSKPILFFLGRISRNILFNIYQRQTIEYVYSNYVLKHSSEVDNTMEEEIDLSSLNDYIDWLTEKLPPMRKKIFRLSKREYYSNKEIAETMKISESTVATHLSLALRYLRKKLMEHYDKIVCLLVHFLINKT